MSAIVFGSLILAKLHQQDSQVGLAAMFYAVAFGATVAMVLGVR